MASCRLIQFGLDCLPDLTIIAAEMPLTPMVSAGWPFCLPDEICIGRSAVVAV